MFNSFYDLKKWFNDPYTYLDQLAEQNGDTFILNLPMMKGTLLTSNPELIDQISKNPNLVGGIGSKFLHHLIGESVITQHGTDHFQTRKKLNYDFLLNIDKAKIRNFSIQNTYYFLPELKTGATISVAEWANRVTLRTIIDFLLEGSKENTKEQLFDLVLEWKKSLNNSAYFFVKPMQISYSKNFGWGKFINLRNLLHQFIHLQIKECSENNSFLSKMIFEYKWDAKKILEEFVSILMFGHDTSAILIAWWTAHLLGNGIWENFQNDNLIDSSLKESARLTPPVVHLTRVATKDLMIGEYSIKKNQRIFPCIYLSHMNSNFFQSPKSFLPDRFINKSFSPSVYYPFGFGDRICLGKKFAEIQTLEIAKILLAEKKFQFINGKPKPVRQFFLMVPEHGTMVKVL